MLFHHLILIILNQFLIDLIYNLKMRNITFLYHIYAAISAKKERSKKILKKPKNITVLLHEQ